MISASIVQLNTIILANFSVNHFSDGIVTSLNNAKTIWQLPYGIFAVAVGNVMLPSLAGHYASGDHKSARAGLFWQEFAKRIVSDNSICGSTLTFCGLM